MQSSLVTVTKATVTLTTEENIGSAHFVRFITDAEQSAPCYLA